MRDKRKTFLFELKIISFILAVALTPTIFFGCAYFNPPEPTHYYKIQRLNYNGEVIQTYYSKSYPYGTDFIDFKEYPSGKLIKLKCGYIAEDLGTNKPTIK
jgi:predicted amidohydrolase